MIMYRLLKILFAASVFSATYANANEAGNVDVNVNYVSTCTIPETVTLSIDGTEAYRSDFIFRVPYQCTIANDRTRVNFWINRFTVYEDEEALEHPHEMIFFKRNGVTYSQSEHATDDGFGNKGLFPINFLLDKGDYDSFVEFRARIGRFSGPPEERSQARFESFTRVTPINVEFEVEN
jgi:hypothetical protein